MSQRTHVAWQKADVELLITWMEENPEALRGKQSAWHKDVKDLLFADVEYITVRKITDKVGNIKASWKNARDVQQRSGWGLKAEDNEASINDILERKCPFFWRLDALWGPRPNARAITSTGSISQSTTQLSAETPAENSAEDIAENSTEGTVETLTAEQSTESTNISGLQLRPQETRDRRHQAQIDMDKRRIEIEERRIKIEERRMEFDAVIRQKQIEANQKIAQINADPQRQ